jgi:hypothetical protein
MNLAIILARIRQFAPLLLVLLSALIAVASYSQALNFPYVLDDIPYVVWNTKLSGLHASELWRLFTEPYNDLAEFLPLRDLSYWLDITLFGQAPSVFRMHNILLYLFCLPFVYGITVGLWRYFRPADAASAPWAAATVTALFALHPSHAEAVVWIAGRKDVQAMMFSLIALWFAVQARKEQALSPLLATVALAALMAAMLSKATAIAVAPVLVVLWMMFWHDIPASKRRQSFLLWPLASMLMAACVAVIFAAINTEKVPLYFGIEAVTRSLAVLGWLARLSISSESRHFYYPVFEDSRFYIMVSLGIMVLSAAGIGAVMILKKRSLEGFALVTFLLLCSPSIQLSPYAPPSLVSDRFVALALWPAVLLVVALLWRLKPVFRTVFLMVIALSWGWQNAERPRDWKSFETLVDKDLRAYPGYYMPAVYKITSFQLPRGLYLDAEITARRITTPEIRDVMISMISIHHGGDADAAVTGKLQEAMVLLWKLERELKQPPAQARWNSPLINLWERLPYLLGTEWQYLATRFPGDVSIRYNAGLWMLDAKRYPDAVGYLRDATKSPDLPKSLRGIAYESLGVSLMNTGKITEAEASLRDALKQTPPDLQAYCSLAEIYRQTGRTDEAARAGANCPNSTDRIPPRH